MIYALCGVESQDYWGNPDWNRTFTLNQMVDDLYVEVVFSMLRKTIFCNLLETYISAGKVLDLDDRILNGVSIPMRCLESALALYEDIKQKFPELLPQFYSVSASILNRNFEPQKESEVDTEPPF